MPKKNSKVKTNTEVLVSVLPFSHVCSLVACVCVCPARRMFVLSQLYDSQVTLPQMQQAHMPST